MPCIENDCFSGHSLGSYFTDLKVIAGGAHGCVFSAVDKTSTDSQSVALKRLSLKSRSHCRVALREIRLARRLKHENIVKILKVTNRYGKEIGTSSHHDRENLDSVYVVQELMDTDLHNILEKSGKLPEEITRLFLYQILRGLKYIHSSNVVHRDIKPGNLLVNLDDLTLKIADFGLARVCDPRYDHDGYLTELVTTRYYRAPEVILEPGAYSNSVDIWSVGCVFAEMLTGDVLFCGDNDMQQADTILSAYGTKSTGKLGAMSGKFPSGPFLKASQLAIDLLEKLLCLDPGKRLTAAEALAHPYFGELRNPHDEPICTTPFLVEHEVDDLSLNTLKRRIVSTCGQFVSKVKHLDEDVLFADFDEVLVSEDNHQNSMDITDHYSLSFGCVPREQQSSSISDTSDTSYKVPSVLSTSLENNNCPSLSNVMNYDPMDEPCRDPGCFGLKEAFTSAMDIGDHHHPSEHISPTYHLKVSPVLDLPPTPPMIKEQKIIECEEDTNMIEIKTNSKNTLNQYRTFCGRNSVGNTTTTTTATTTTQSTVFDRSRNLDHLDSTGNNNLYSINKKVIEDLGNIAYCRMSEVVTNKTVNFDTLGLCRLEPLRFWI